MLTEKYDDRPDTERLDACDGRGGPSHLLEARLLYVPTSSPFQFIYMKAN